MGAKHPGGYDETEEPMDSETFSSGKITIHVGNLSGAGQDQLLAALRAQLEDLTDFAIVANFEVTTLRNTVDNFPEEDYLESDESESPEIPSLHHQEGRDDKMQSMLPSSNE